MEAQNETACALISVGSLPWALVEQALMKLYETLFVKAGFRTLSTNRDSILPAFPFDHRNRGVQQLGGLAYGIEIGHWG